MVTSANPLAYQSRDGYFEGQRTEAISGQRIVVLSLTPYGPNQIQLPPDSLRMQFLLPGPEATPRPVVREAIPTRYYWFDNPTMSDPRRGFVWSRRILDRIGVPDSTLHLLVPLGEDDPILARTLAPATLGHSLPDSVSQYRLSFRSNDDCLIAFSATDGEGTVTPCSPDTLELLAGEVSYVTWTPPGLEGVCRIRLNGFSLNDNEQIRRVVAFHHRPLPHGPVR